MAEINTLFEEMNSRGASDLHLVVGRPPMFRISGDLVETDRERLTPDTARRLIYAILNDAQRAQIESHLDLDFAYELPEVARFRANILHHYRGLGGVFRLIPSKVLTLEDLRMPDVVRKIAEFPAGLVLVTGPTGSGK